MSMGFLTPKSRLVHLTTHSGRDPIAQMEGDRTSREKKTRWTVTLYWPVSPPSIDEQAIVNWKKKQAANDFWKRRGTAV